MRELLQGITLDLGSHHITGLPAALILLAFFGAVVALVVRFVLVRRQARRARAGREAAERESRRAHEDVRISEARYRMLFEHNPCPMWVYDLDTLAVLDVNDAAVAQYGYSRGEFVGMTLRDLRAPEDAERLEALLGEIRADQPMAHVAGHRRKDGSRLDVEVRDRPLPMDGKHWRIVVATDVTDRTRLEARLRQSEKMEAVGALAGGIAHDFNNMLTVVTGCAQLLMTMVGDNEEAHQLADEIASVAERSANLTRQLLTFSRGHAAQTRLVDVGRHVRETGPLLGRLVTEAISLTVRSDDPGICVLFDPAQLTQVLLNLVTNARDAMPSGGRITITVGSVVIDDESAAQYPALERGRHAVITVADTGSGMDAATQSRLFEPFFTTKPEGRGTGLGLATVFGIVKQARGMVWVYSEPRKGTTFRVYLPEFVGPAPVPVGFQPVLPEAFHLPAPRQPSTRSTVLLVEDDDVVRKVGATLLGRAGFAVVQAADGNAALELVTSAAIDVVVTDTVMPRMGGTELIARLSESHPGLPVILTSGYTEETLDAQGVNRERLIFLEKPYTAQALVEAVEEALRGASLPGAATTRE